MARDVTHSYDKATDTVDEAVRFHQVQSGKSKFTVIGVWDDDEAIPVGVIWGEHSVVGGDEEHWEGGLWATSVEAADPEAAERAAIDVMAE